MKVAVLSAAVGLAAIANVIVFLVVTGPLGEPLLMCDDCSSTPPLLSPLGLIDPILFSVLFGVGAVVVYVVIERLSRRPMAVFTVVAAVVLGLSLAMPAMIPSPPVTWAAKLTLFSMHVVGLAVILTTLRLADARGLLSKRGG